MHIPPPVIATVCIGIQYVCYRYWPELNLNFPLQQPVGVVLAMLGFVIPVWAALHFRRAQTTILPHKMQDTSALVTSGPYRYSRNPMYLGMGILIAGCGIWTGTLITLIVLPIFVLIINRWQILPEERALVEIFGSEFESYKQVARRWI